MKDIFDLIGQQKLMVLWNLFLQEPDREFGQAEVLKKSRLAKATGIKWLRTLEKNHIVTARQRGRLKYYQLTRNPLNKLLKTMSTVALLLPLADRQGIDVYLFGSAARGEDTPASDIDLLVIGKISPQEFAGEIARLRLHRQVAPVIFTPLEWATMKSKDPVFYERVEKDKVRITWT